MSYTIVYGDEVTSTGTITLTPLIPGATTDQVGQPIREVRSTVEMTSKQIDKWVNSEMVFTLNEGTTLRG